MQPLCVAWNKMKQTFVMCFFVTAHCLLVRLFLILLQLGEKAASLNVAELYVSAFSNLAKTNNTVVLPANVGDAASMVAQVNSGNTLLIDWVGGPGGISLAQGQFTTHFKGCEDKELHEVIVFVICGLSDKSKEQVPSTDGGYPVGRQLANSSVTNRRYQSTTCPSIVGGGDLFFTITVSWGILATSTVAKKNRAKISGLKAIETHCISNFIILGVPNNVYSPKLGV